MWVRGLKLIIAGLIIGWILSHPMWVRGLKRRQQLSPHRICQSHPMWVRGLKHKWLYVRCLKMRRIPCGCVD